MIKDIEVDSCDNLVVLIKLYCQLVNQYSQQLSLALKVSDLTDWRVNKVAQQGQFNQSQWRYAFHGSGCFISSQQYHVDFEFDKHCDVGGFDVWRLWSFVEDNEEKCLIFSEFKDKKHLEKIFAQLNDMGVISMMNGHKQSDLFFVSNVEGDS